MAAIATIPVPLAAASPPGFGRRIAPGLGLCLLVTAAAFGLEHAEAALFGRAWLEALVLAILLGTAVRTAWTPGKDVMAGVNFSAKTLLEVAVLLLGVSISARTVLAMGWGMLAGIAGVVVAAIAISYGIGRLLGLPKRMAVLVACGNSICGNSAIAAVAPVIGADGEDVASSIAFTAVLGVVVVLGLPLLGVALGMSGLQFGALAGLTVYAVPQVLAATAPMGAVAVQIGTLVVLVLSLLTPRLREETDEPAPHVTAGDRPKPGRLALHRLVPWFILGFLVLAGLRSAGAVPDAAVGPALFVANILTVVSMAALGLGVDVRTVAKAGPRVTGAVCLSLLALGGISLGLIRLLGIA